MIACMDVFYDDLRQARAACVVFPAWSSEKASWEGTIILQDVAPYVPGQFYKRELPCLLAILDKAPKPLDTLVVDGYVYLSSEGTPGLGAHLYESLGRTTPVIGVAKTHFDKAPATEVLRGSKHPLYVTAAGMPEKEAADLIQGMYGPYRIPTLLKRVDTLSRGWERADNNWGQPLWTPDS